MLDSIKENGLDYFVPSAYFYGESTKFVSTTLKTLDHPSICVDGKLTHSEIILNDDGEKGDDVAGDGIYSRGCIHLCDSSVDFRDIYGYAHELAIYGVNSGARIHVVDNALKGSVPMTTFNLPLSPDAYAIATSHAFFFIDEKATYFPEYPVSEYPNSFAEPSARAVPVQAITQIFGDVFDFITVGPMEGYLGGGIYKWQNWDLIGGSQPSTPFGDTDLCIMSVTGVPLYRLNAVITAYDLQTYSSIWIHEMVHATAGFEYHNQLDKARTGDGMHVPGSCTDDHSHLQGPVWDWERGYPWAIAGTGSYGVRLVPNEECFDCADDDNLHNCCTFRYEDIPETKQAIEAKKELTAMSPLALYISGMKTLSEITDPKDKTYFCVGFDDGGFSVDESNTKRIKATHVTRFTLEDLIDANGGEREPKRKWNLIRHASVHVSIRRPSEAEIVFYTLLIRHFDEETRPHERRPDFWGNRREVIYPWKFSSHGLSKLHSKLNGIDCCNKKSTDIHCESRDIFSQSVPSCMTQTSNACSGSPCHPQAVCQMLDGQPLCTCKPGLVGDGNVCVYPSMTNSYATNYKATELFELTWYSCFSESTKWPERPHQIAAYPGGIVPYAAAASCGDEVCQVGGSCISNKCEPPRFPAPADPASPFKCNDPATCCFWPCSRLKLEHGGTQISQEGNCGGGCTVGIVPDTNGREHFDLYMLSDVYYSGGEVYNYEEGPLKVDGQNMFERCKNKCFTENPATKFIMPGTGSPIPMRNTGRRELERIQGDHDDDDDDDDEDGGDHGAITCRHVVGSMNKLQILLKESVLFLITTISRMDMSLLE
eukprot:CAMPEP_0198286700 /NCGR_PEP_ID=MMETSP1449-20131203/5698_1 /TAXON_ID=420275 /ORGANISM="Attheya septentrionalis, Strain CCMP2084" /LENGTH=823 /DNA_ID=CAMNT_0043984485 /DNA_START=392 /DNA_END=2864 /DNA_ORIENTATION=+